MSERVKIKIGNDDLILETGKMAKQANGSVFATYGGSSVLATVCCSDNEREGLDFVPLSVDYNEKYYAAGKIPGGFIKRETRPKDKEILVSRLIDRPMRPLFYKDFSREIQLVPTTISADQTNPPDMIAMVAASAAVTISDIPFEGPIGAVRVCSIEGEFIINPTFTEIENSELDIIVSGTEEGITMVEGGSAEAPESLLLAAIKTAHDTIKEICKAQKELRKKAGKEKLPLSNKKNELENRQEIWDFVYPKLQEACFVKGKHTRGNAIKAVKQEASEKFEETIPEEFEKAFEKIIEEAETDIVRKSILEKQHRTDGRGPSDIRDITCEVGLLPRVHGSALFTRGETQALAVATLGTVYDEQIMDNIDGDQRESFMLHYNFPPFSVGETGRLFTGRREIGHGHLAQRALYNMLPGKDDFPYTIRLVSEILESNGSSSMATVCGGTLALLDTGVPMKKPVAGIAMGMITDEKNSVILSDILGEEDHLGDMDFKVAGTEDGITAFQMDIKVSNVSYEIMENALEQARQGRLHILNIMNNTIGHPRKQLSDYAPKIINMKVDSEKIGTVIGPGGKTIRTIQEKTGATVNIDNDGLVNIYCKDKDGAEEAEKMLSELIEEPEVGKVYNGTVKRIMDFGAFIEILPGREGLCHISKLSKNRVESVHDVLELEQEIPIKLMEIDKMGRLNLSYIDAIEPGYSDSKDSSKSGDRNSNRDNRHGGGNPRHDEHRNNK